MDHFSLIFKAAKLQIGSLFEEVESEKALSMLDAVVKLPEAQRDKILDAITSTLKKFETSQDVEDSKFVETLVTSITNELKSPRLAVISGGNKSSSSVYKKSSVFKVIQ